MKTNSICTSSRRDFIGRTLLASSAATLAPGLFSSLAAERTRQPIILFSKVYQELKLGYAEAAEVTVEAGLDGIDCPVRPRGEVLPERVVEDLPRYAEELRRRNVQLSMLTTAILGVSSPHTEQILRTAKKLGVQSYRLGYINPEPGASAQKQISELRARLKDLAALNKEIGIGALCHNHSPSGRTTYLGGDLAQMQEIVAGFDPAQVGMAFDIGHAVIVHGEDWRAHFERLKPQIRVAYFKDSTRDGRWVPFGHGEVGRSGYCKLLKEAGYHGPLEIHIEFDWDEGGKARNRPTLVKALKQSSEVLQRWMAEA